MEVLRLTGDELEMVYVKDPGTVRDSEHTSRSRQLGSQRVCEHSTSSCFSFHLVSSPFFLFHSLTHVLVLKESVSEQSALLRHRFPFGQGLGFGWCLGKAVIYLIRANVPCQSKRCLRCPSPPHTPGPSLWKLSRHPPVSVWHLHRPSLSCCLIITTSSPAVAAEGRAGGWMLVPSRTRSPWWVCVRPQPSPPSKPAAAHLQSGSSHTASVYFVT